MTVPRFGVGDEVRGFVIEGILASSPTATIYAATQMSPRRALALKVSERHGDAEAHLRALEVVVRIEHPGVIPIYAVWRDDETCFVAMRRADGDLAGELGAGGRMSLAEVARVVDAVAAALDAVHAMGLVHRDLKPSNILVGRGPSLSYQLSDFGSPSMGGQPAGTLDYMAPEVAAGRDAGPAADIYALGCVVVECLTGEVPFARDSPMATLMAHFHDPPPSLIDRRPDLPRELDAVVAKSLAKDPSERYRTAGELAVAFAGLLASATLAAPIMLSPIPDARSEGAVAAAPGEAPPSPHARPSWASETTFPVAVAAPPRGSGGGLLGRLRSILPGSRPPRQVPVVVSGERLEVNRTTRPDQERMLAGWSAGHGPAPDPVREVSAADEGRPGDRVECSVHAPPSAAPESQFLVQAWIHTVAQTEQVASLAQVLDSDARLRAFRTLELRLRRETTLMIELRLPGGIVDEPSQSVVWTGSPQAATFGVRLRPDLTMPSTLIGTVSIVLDGVPIGHLKFKVAVGAPGAGETALKPAGASAVRYQQAFVSYSSDDRQKVLPRVQMLEALGIRFFQDLLSLESGERWEPELQRQIDTCDLFLLFWSEHAKNSEWVRREVLRAIERKAGDDLRPPEIRPVILEGPPVPKPWDELRYLHFNDRVLYFLDR